MYLPPLYEPPQIQMDFCLKTQATVVDRAAIAMDMKKENRKIYVLI